jgi:hypothetical protein
MVPAGSGGGRGELGGSRGSSSWRLSAGGGGERGMHVLLRELWERRYHSQEGGDGFQRQATAGPRESNIAEAGGDQGNQPLPSGIELNHADPAQVSVRGGVKQRQAQAVERMGRIDDLDCLRRQR